MTTTCIPKTQAAAVTTAHPFGSLPSSASGIFCVREGVPLDDAFNELHMLIDVAIQALDEMAMKESLINRSCPLWSILSNLNMANALVQSMQIGLTDNESTRA